MHAVRCASPGKECFRRSPRAAPGRLKTTWGNARRSSRRSAVKRAPTRTLTRTRRLRSSRPLVESSFHEDVRVLTPEILGRTFADAPDPELARIAFSRVGATPEARDLLGRPDVLPVASSLLGFSTAAADLLVRHPEEI